MGNYIFSTRTLLRLLHDDAAERRAASTISAATSCPSWPATPRSSPTISRPTASPASRPTRRLTGATSAPSTPTTKPTWTCAPSARAQSLQPRMAAAHHQLSGSARQVHLRRREPPRPGHRLHRLRRLHSLRRHGAEFGAGPRRAGTRRRAGGRLRHSGQLRYRPPRQDPPRHPR